MRMRFAILITAVLAMAATGATRPSPKMAAELGIKSLGTGSEKYYGITPGVYKLQWKKLPDFEIPSGSHGMQVVKQQGGRSRFSGYVSAEALWAALPRFVGLLDESKGTGKGYDTLYLFDAPDPGAGWPDDEYQVKNAKLALKMGAFDKYGPEPDRSRKMWINTSPRLAPVDPGKAVVTVTMGKGSTQNTKRTALDVRIYSGPVSAYGLSIDMVSGWVGQIKTTLGPRFISTQDPNADGVFRGPIYKDGKLYDFGDRVWFERRDWGQGYSAPIGEDFAFGGRYYRIESSPDGSTITIKKLSKPGKPEFVNSGEPFRE